MNRETGREGRSFKKDDACLLQAGRPQLCMGEVDLANADLPHRALAQQPPAGLSLEPARAPCMGQKSK